MGWAIVAFVFAAALIGFCVWAVRDAIKNGLRD